MAEMAATRLALMVSSARSPIMAQMDTTLEAIVVISPLYVSSTGAICRYSLARIGLTIGEAMRGDSSIIYRWRVKPI
jgi:hypothetical protein